MLKQLSLKDFATDLCSITETVSDTDSCSITVSVIDTDPCSITKPVSERQPKSLLRFLNRAQANATGGVGIYRPGKRKAQYFRFSYRLGNCTKHHHIPGGNIYSALALERAMEIQQMADREVSIVDILDRITNFS